MTERAPRTGVSDALAMIRASVLPLGTEAVPAALSWGRITAAPVYARADTPRFRASAMDGYAMASNELKAATADKPIKLSLCTLVPAGTWPELISYGEAVPIATGAPLPEGADAVVTNESAKLVDGKLWVSSPVEAGLNVRAIGEDCEDGAMVLPAGMCIAPDAVGALVTYGVERVLVRMRPRIGLITTGSELETDTKTPAAAMLTDSNGPMIAACAAAAGVPCHFIGRAPDSIHALDALLDAALAPDSGDVILSTGGVSVGTFDLVRGRLEALGCNILFHGVAMRPGKPLLFALLPDGRPYFGLPGTPLAALVALRFFVGAALRQMLGLPIETGEPVLTAESGRPGMTLFLRGRRVTRGGMLAVDIAMDQRAHIFRSLLTADCWLRLDGAGPDGPVARCYPRQLMLD